MTHQVLWNQRATRVNHVGAAVVTGMAVLSVPGSEILMDIVVIIGLSLPRFATASPLPISSRGFLRLNCHDRACMCRLLGTQMPKTLSSVEVALHTHTASSVFPRCENHLISY